MAKRWVKHFDTDLYSKLNPMINLWLTNNPRVNIVGISVYPIRGTHFNCYGAEVIVEEKEGADR